MMTDDSTPNEITLLLADGEEMCVKYELVATSGPIRETFAGCEFECNNNEFPLQSVTKEVMCKVLEYCEYHLNEQEQPTPAEEAEAATNLDDPCEWDVKFAESMHPRMALDCVVAADYLEMVDLRTLLCRDIAVRIHGLKTAPEIREKLCIESDMTQEEEDRLRKEVEEKFMKGDENKEDSSEDDDDN